MNGAIAAPMSRKYWSRAFEDVARGKEEVGELSEDETVVARVGLGESREATAAFVVELPPSTIDAADRGAVSADELGRRVHDDVRAVLEGPAEERRRERVVDDEGNPVVVGDPGHPLEVEHVALRVAEGLCEERLGVGPNGGRPLFEIVRILNERRLDAELGNV